MFLTIFFCSLSLFVVLFSIYILAVEAMEKTEIKEGSKVMEQGDVDGSYMYIVGTGFFNVYVSGTLVNTLGPGSLFGELALLFAAPRNATIVLASSSDEEDAINLTLKKDELKKDELKQDELNEGNDCMELEEEETQILWRIHRDRFEAVMLNDRSNDAVESLKGRFSVNSSERRHKNKKHNKKHRKDRKDHRKHYHRKERNKETKKNSSTSLIALPPESSSVESSVGLSTRPNISKIQALHECELVLEDLLVFSKKIAPRIPFHQMSSIQKWKYAIQKTIVRNQVHTTKRFLKGRETSLSMEEPATITPITPVKRSLYRRGSSQLIGIEIDPGDIGVESSSSSSESEDEAGKEGNVSDEEEEDITVILDGADVDVQLDLVVPRKVSVEGREWDVWLKKEVEALSRQLVENGIDDKTFARRRSLLEKRWSENV